MLSIVMDHYYGYQEVYKVMDIYSCGYLELDGHSINLQQASQPAGQKTDSYRERTRDRDRERAARAFFYITWARVGPRASAGPRRACRGRARAG